MKDAQKPDHVTLNTLVGYLREGRYVIPDFQREFEWEPTDINELMKSIFSDQYIGSLLLWRSSEENRDALACEPIYGYSGDGRPEQIVLDGQQRLTAMYYAFMAPDKNAPKRENRYLYFIRVDQFTEEAFDQAFVYDWTRRGVRLLDDKERQFREHRFPLSVVGNEGWALPNWMQDYQKFWEQQHTLAIEQEDTAAAEDAARYVEGARSFSDTMQGITEQYQVAYIELDRALPLDKVCEIFTNINSRGIRLDIFDLVNALLRPKDLQLKALWREAEPRLDFVHSERLNVYVLQVMSLLLQEYCSPKYLYYMIPGFQRTLRSPDGSLRRETLVPNVDDFEHRWHTAVDALERSIHHLQNPHDFGAVSSAYLPYVAILPAFTALQQYARTLPPVQQPDAGRKIRQWYWASVFTKRYSGSVESTSARDFRDVTAWFDYQARQPDLIEEFEEGFRALQFRGENRRGTSIYNGIFNLLVMSGAKDWFSGNAPHHGQLDDHHIVPRSWGHDHNVGSEIDSILNRTPLSADTNQRLGNRLPSEHLAELMDASGEQTVRATLETHLIPPTAFDILCRTPFTPGDFEEFLIERERTIRGAIESLLVKERLSLEPELAKLDAAVKQTEVRLRKLVATAIDNRIEQVPSHVMQTVNERIATPIRKDPMLERELEEQAAAKLDYFDLRHLADTISSMVLWPMFEQRFGAKEQLHVRFSHLAELRNCLSHSRAVNEITQKDGEAAILWFERTLA